MPDDFEVVVGKRRIILDPGPDPEPDPEPEPEPVRQPDVIVQSNGSTLAVEMKTKRMYKRNGNGHKSQKTRDLLDTEKNMLRYDLFLSNDGQIDEDDCVLFRRSHDSLFADVGIFQITGFISVLHTQVAEGRLSLKDIQAYELWMRTKYGRLWARYNHPLYVKARANNAEMIAKGLPPTYKINGKIPDNFQAPNVQEPTLETEVFRTGQRSLTPMFVTFKKRFAGV
jgi:adenylylsulfate kinase-like enzyme